MTQHESARPCGCDPGANWICEQHTNAIFGDCITCDGYVTCSVDAPYCPTCARLRNEKSGAALQRIMAADDADDQSSRDRFVASFDSAINGLGDRVMDKYNDLIDAGLTPKESPVERALQSLMNACDDVALAIWNAESKDHLRTIRTEIESQITRLETQSTVAQTLIEHFDERRKP